MSLQRQVHLNWKTNQDSAYWTCAFSTNKNNIGTHELVALPLALLAVHMVSIRQHKAMPECQSMSVPNGSVEFGLAEQSFRGSRDTMWGLVSMMQSVLRHIDRFQAYDFARQYSQDWSFLHWTSQSLLCCDNISRVSPSSYNLFSYNRSWETFWAFNKSNSVVKFNFGGI